MPVTKLATQVPAPQVWSYSTYLQDYLVSLSVPSLITAKTILQKATTWVAQFNFNAAYLDVNSQYGGGHMGIVHGLTVSAGSGLQVNIAAGGALIGGVCQLKTSTTAVVTASQTNYVWFKKDKTVEVTLTTTPPAGGAILLGIAITDGSGVTSVDTSGVCYIKGGLVYRETADLAEPLDTPPNGLLMITKTLAGEYLWSGSGNGYKLLLPPLATILPVVADKTETATDRYKVVTNEGTTVKPVITLESAAAGITRTFIVQDSDGIRIVAASGDTIRIGTSISSSGGYAESTTIGSTLTLIAINATEWFAISSLGTWSVA